MTLLIGLFVPEKAVMHYQGKEIRSLETQVVTSSRQKLIGGHSSKVCWTRRRDSLWA